MNTEKPSYASRRQAERVLALNPHARQAEPAEPKTATERQAAQILAAMRDDGDGK